MAENMAVFFAIDVAVFACTSRISEDGCRSNFSGIQIVPKFNVLRVK